MSLSKGESCRFESDLGYQLYRELPEWSIGASWKGDGCESGTRVQLPYSLPNINIRMSTCYIRLPEIYKTYIRDNVLETIHEAEKSYPRFGKASTHSMVRVPNHMILTEEGVKRFSNYWPIIDLFKLTPNCSSLLHSDNSYHAFNFIVTNNGYMEWFDIDKLEFELKTKEGQKIYKFSEEAIVDRTECNMMWVNTKIPHRIVNNTDQERWCISMRSLTDTPYTI